MKKKLLVARHRSTSFSSAGAGSGATSSKDNATSVALEEMDENEVVSRIMQEVRRCESAARRSLRRPSELSYSLDKNGGIVSNHSGQNSRKPEHHSVGNASPLPPYKVEVNTDRVGSMTREIDLNRTYEYLMRGTQRRTNNSQTRKARGAGRSGIADHYNMVRYNSEETDNSKACHCKPPAAPLTPKDCKQQATEDDHLDQSTSSHSSSSSGTPQPTSPSIEDDKATARGNVPAYAETGLTTSSALMVVPPAPAGPAFLCTGMSWLTGACEARSNKPPPSTTPSPASPPRKVPAIYDRISRPFRGPSEMSGRSLRTISTKSDMISFASQHSEGNSRNARVFFDTSNRDYDDDEEDVDVMRPWHLGSSSLTAAALAKRRPGVVHPKTLGGIRSSSHLSSHSAISARTLETIPERSSEGNESSLLHVTTPLRRESSYYSSSPRRHPSSYSGSQLHRHSPNNRRTVLRSIASQPSEYDSQYADDDKTLSSSRTARGVGCMAILQGVLKGIDEAEKAFLDDDSWADLYDEEDIYTESSSQAMSTDQSYWTRGRSDDTRSTYRSNSRYFAA